MSKYNHSQSRTKAQAERMKDLENRSVCAFCPEHIKTETTSPIEIETDYWSVKDNDYPYKNTKLHLIAIPKQHAKTVSELSIKAQQEFLLLVSQIEEDYSLESYTIAMRSGDMRLNGGSVEHIHAHIVVGDTDNHDHEPVRFKMSSKPT